LNSIAGRTIGRPFVDAWFNIQRRYDELYPHTATDKVIKVENVNDDATVNAISDLRPDLVVVSGTNLVGKRLIEASKLGIGIINLHTGISPYVKGGPNCTNWCLAKNWFHLIGSTVMWLDLGIDTGNIISTEQTPLTGDETLTELHWKVMEHAHKIYVAAIHRIARGESVPSVPQASIDKGSHFNSVDWNFVQIHRAKQNFRRNFKRYFSDIDRYRHQTADLQLFPVLDV
jgi:methionyl-tRNA formyltransferase